MVSKTQTSICSEKSIVTFERLVEILFSMAIFSKKASHSFALLMVKLLSEIPSIPFPNSAPLETV